MSEANKLQLLKTSRLCTMNRKFLSETLNKFTVFVF